MDQVEIMQFINRNPTFSMATCSDNVPYVRTMTVAFADNRGIVLATGREKDVCRQMQANPRIEMCFYNAQNGVQVRIAGTAAEVDDVQLKKDIVEKFDFLKPWVEAQGYDILAAFRVTNARATTWTMADMAKPKEYVTLTKL